MNDPFIKKLIEVLPKCHPFQEIAGLIKGLLRDHGGW